LKWLIYFSIMLLKVENLSLSYGDWKVLDKFNFEMNQGQVLCVLGESGCGKTSLLKAIRGFMDRDEGEIHFQGERVYNKSEKLVPGTKGVAIVHQDFQLEPGFTVFDNIRHHLIQYHRSYQQSKTEEIIRLCKLEKIQLKKSKELSGGQKQKVALAKALIEEPPLLLLDEPFSNLDNISKAEFKSILKNVVKALNIGLLFVTHDSKDALTFSDEIMVIQNGKLLKKDTPLKLTTAPPSVYAAKLLGLTNIFEGSLIKSITDKSIQDSSNYWVPQREIKISKGNAFTVEAEEFLGDQFVYHLSNGILNVSIKSLERLTDEKLNIRFNNAVEINN
jgi:ABC-type Fe3+/spermidine/putrescine transport system ATPase subunit